MNRVRKPATRTVVQQAAIPQQMSNVSMMTAKEIAQTFIVNDIIMHELILEAINSIEEALLQTNNSYTRAEIINRICVLVSRDELASIFDIKRGDVLCALRLEYFDEITSLAHYNND